MAREIGEILEFRFGSEGEPGCGEFRDEDAAHPHPRRQGEAHDEPDGFRPDRLDGRADRPSGARRGHEVTAGGAASRRGVSHRPAASCGSRRRTGPGIPARRSRRGRRRAPGSRQMNQPTTARQHSGGGLASYIAPSAFGSWNSAIGKKV